MESQRIHFSSSQQAVVEGSESGRRRGPRRETVATGERRNTFCGRSRTTVRAVQEDWEGRYIESSLYELWFFLSDGQKLEHTVAVVMDPDFAEL